ncbi:hypothetical protein MF451_003820 [Salmonella enterica subsp. enterica serovar Saintpaul]|nr:hypothetical protein [Salmonella enterica subsp. enterica serovar Saintpaul]
MSVFFNGALLVTPQTASVVNDDAMLNQNLSVGNAVAFVGESDAGEPLKVLTFSTPEQARNTLMGGELCDAVVSAFAPSSQTGGPQTVSAVRVNKATQAKLDLFTLPKLDANDGHELDPARLFGTLYGKTWSKADLNVKVKIEQGTSAHVSKVTVMGGTGTNAWTLVGEDVDAPRFHIDFLEADCAITFGGDTGKKNFITVEVDHSHSNSNTAGVYQKYDLSFNDYRTLGDVADFLVTLKNNAGNYVFKVNFDDISERKLSSAILDKVAYTSTGVGANAAPGIKDIRWTQWAFQQWIDTYLGDALMFVPDADAHLYVGRGLQTHDFKYLTTTAITPASDVEWQAGFDLLTRKDVQWVCPVSENPYHHIIAKNHVTVCSNQLRKERRAIVGMGTKVQMDDAIDHAKELNSGRVSLVTLGHYVYDATGKLVLRPAYMTAALIAGAFAGVNPGTPLTNKSLNIQGIEKDLINPSETDEMLKAGIIPIENTDRGFIITQSISTWLTNSKYNLREQSCGVAVDFAIRNVRQAVDPLRGEKQSPILLSRAISLTKGVLTELARPEPQGPAVLVGDEKSPAWRNVSATIEGDVLRIQFEASPAIPNNYILVTMYAVPYSGSATA